MASRRNSFEVLLAFAIGCLVVGAMASSAHAAGKTYCAWDTLASPVDPSCELNFGWSSAGVNNAVVAAADMDPTGRPDWRDVVIVPARGQVTVRIRFVDIAGRTVYHCHILFHGDGGMMGVVEVVA